MPAKTVQDQPTRHKPYSITCGWRVSWIEVPYPWTRSRISIFSEMTRVLLKALILLRPVGKRIKAIGSRRAWIHRRCDLPYPVAYEFSYSTARKIVSARDFVPLVIGDELPQVSRNGASGKSPSVA